MIKGVTQAGALPVLERAMQFAARRHELISHNVANLTTPHFRPVDVSPQAFQLQLQEAIDQRRERFGNIGGSLEMQDNREVSFTEQSLTLHPEPAGENIMFQDGNDRDVERTMQDLVENFTAFRTAAQFVRREFDTLNIAIRERI